MTQQHSSREAASPTHAMRANAGANPPAHHDLGGGADETSAVESTDEMIAAEQARARRFADLITQAAQRFGATLANIEHALDGAENSWRSDPASQHTAMTHLRADLADARAMIEALHVLAPLQAEDAAAGGLLPRWVEAVELGDLLMGILPRWKTRAPQTPLELALPGEVPTVLAESALVERALDALLGYMVAQAPSGDTVRVSIRPRPEHVLVSLRHHGRTLPPQALNTLFEPESVAQVGLFLALARAIVEAHGGRVWAEQPEDGAGVTLHAEWPMVPPGKRPGKRYADGATREGMAPLAMARRHPGSVISPETTHTPGGLVRGAPLSPVPSVPSMALRPPRARPVVLVAHTDARMTRYLRANLEEGQYQSVAAASLNEALRAIEREEPEVILLDGNLCGVSLEELTTLRAASAAPILVLPRRADPTVAARALDLGACDVLTTPFAMEELLARVRAALRERAATHMDEGERHYRVGELEVDLGERRVSRGGRPIALSKTEFKLLRVLAEHMGMVLTHDVLLERVWGPAYGREVGFLWVYIRRLRRKVEPDPAHPRYILTVPGIGYRLARDEQVCDETVMTVKAGSAEGSPSGRARSTSGGEQP